MKTNFLIPVKKMNARSDCFIWPALIFLKGSEKEDLIALDQLKQDLSFLPGKREVKTELAESSTKQTTLSLLRTRNISNAEGYIIEIAPETIKIESSTAAGAYYGIQTLREMLKMHREKCPCCKIEDEPDFKRRGIYLDISRGKVPKLSFLKKLTEKFSQWKLNEVQLYIENTFLFINHPKIAQGFSPYSAEDILDLKEHCKKHHIRLVPSLASFGHLEKILAIPEYSHLAEYPQSLNYSGGTSLNPDNPDSIKFITELYDEFLPLFDDINFNACCDEVSFNPNNSSSMNADRFKNFVNKLTNVCEKKHGKRLNIWADAIDMRESMLDELHKDITLLDYSYQPNRPHTETAPDRAHRISKTERPFLMCPGTSSWCSNGTFLDISMANVAQLAEEGRAMGAEGILNTDWGDAGHRQPQGCSMHSFAHSAAHSWHGQAVDETNFTKNFCSHFWGEKADQISEYIRMIGANSAKATSCDQAMKASAWASISSRLYFALVTPFDDKADQFRDIDPRTPLKQIYSHHWNPCLKNIAIDKCAEIIEDCERSVPAAESNDDFGKIILEDLQLAAEMDALACKRVIFYQNHISNYTENKKQAAAKLLDASQKLSRSFEDNWLKRNRISRLEDNLTIMKQNINDLEKIMGKLPVLKTKNMNSENTREIGNENHILQNAGR